MIITIDIDSDNVRLMDRCITDCMPCEVRISPSGKGFHIKKSGSDESSLWKLKEKYDDETRYVADKFRKESGLLHNFLFDVGYYGSVKKYAGEWHVIGNGDERDKFLKEVNKDENSIYK